MTGSVRETYRKLLAASFGLALNICSAYGQLFGGSVKQEAEQGAEVARLVEQQVGVYSNRVAEAYLGQVGARLVAAANDARWNFTFRIVDQQEPNAFAIPGGRIYVSRGLLALVNREDELAGVLAHEIAHVTERHSTRQQRKGILPGILSLPGNIVGGIVSEDLGAIINAPIDTVGGAWLSRYSRGQESDSDRIGMRTAAKAGYDPSALADILGRLEQVIKSQTGREHEFSIFDSHPMTETRLKEIRSRAAKLTAGESSAFAPSASELFAKLDGIWWGENPEQGVFRKDQFLHVIVGFTIALPPGWKHRNTPQYLVSVAPEKQAVLLFGGGGPEANPEEEGEKFIAKMRSQARTEPISKRKEMLGSYPAFIATYLDRSGRGAVYLDFVWVTMAGRIYQMITMGPEQLRELMWNTVSSLRSLTPAERASVTGKRLRSATCNDGERLAELGSRTSNTWSPAFTALVNGIDPATLLANGQPVKITREEVWDSQASSQ